LQGPKERFQPDMARTVGGSRKGRVNKRTLGAAEFADAVFDTLGRSPESIAAAFMECDDLRTKSAIFLRMLEYKYGRPKQMMEMSGEGGGPVQHRLVIERIGGPADTTTAE